MCTLKEDNGQSCVSTRWVCTLKETKDEVKTKARLVVRGVEEIGKDDNPKDSPKCANESLKIYPYSLKRTGYHIQWTSRQHFFKVEK